MKAITHYSLLNTTEFQVI